MSVPRSVALERLAYTAVAPALVAAPNLSPDGLISTCLALAGAAGTAGALVAAHKSREGAEGSGRKILRCTPVLLAGAIDVAATYTPGWGWETLAAAVWLGLGWTVLPFSRHARRRHRPALAVPAPRPALEQQPEPVLVPTTDDQADDLTRGARHLWERAGNPGNTHIVHATPHPGTAHDLTLLLRASEPGRPIKNLTEDDVAGAFDIDARYVRLSPVSAQPGRQGGPGWAEATLTPDEALRRRTEPTPAEWWADIIGAERGPVPASTLTAKTRDAERGVTHYLARVPDEMGEPRVNLHALAAALKTRYDEGRLFVTVDGNQVLVSLWDTSPLAQVFPATRELLTPDKDGRWITGYLGNGQPARNRVYTDRGAAHGLFVAPSGGGKTQLMGLHVAADALFGAVVMLATEAPDEKTAALGRHTARYGVGALYMIRLLRAMVALMEIRGEMPWEDGEVHEWDPTRPGCPYRMLSAYLDEFLSAARHGDYGTEIMDLAELVSVKGRKYGVGIKVAGQSVYVQDGFTQLLCENLRENCIPVVLKVAPKKVGDMFKALGVPSEHIPDPLPRSFSPAEAGRIERVMRGEPEPPTDSNTGGAGWIIEGTQPEVLRTLFMNFKTGIDAFFPDTVATLTDHEVRELEARDLWFDWTQPPRPGEFGDDPDEDSEDPGEDGEDVGARTGRQPHPKKGNSRRSDQYVSTPAQALARLKHLTDA